MSQDALNITKEVLEATRVLGWEKDELVKLCREKKAELGDSLSAISEIYQDLLIKVSWEAHDIANNLGWKEGRYSRILNQKIDLSDGSELVGLCKMKQSLKEIAGKNQ